MIYLAPVNRFHRQQRLPINIKAAWNFFSRPENLARITPPDLGFEVTSTLPETMYAGMIISYRVCPFGGIAVPWVTEITHIREPEFFIDEQRSGPYRFWHHQHLFEEVADGVKMTDIVHYQVPFGLFGHWLSAGLVQRRLEGIFDYRQQKLIDIFSD
ncbi:MAG: SRPBCC family protein [Deltaproteobacteria bacterium]|jgi:ligand-binding SRPBCC domain-containing protein|nr:SRPBCC family protein [Deltaproteobacteria bacterium]